LKAFAMMGMLLAVIASGVFVVRLFATRLRLAQCAGP
jgi:hypothetical protein